MKFDDYIPALFRLPIEEVMPGDLVTVTAIFIEPMVFMDGRYKFKMNLKFPKSLVAKDEKQQPYDIDTVMNIHCVINSVNPDAVVHSDTHTLKKEDKKSTNQEIGTENAMIVDVVSFRPESLIAENDENGEPVPLDPEVASQDFRLEYSITSKDILPTFIDEPLVVRENEEKEGNFLLFVTPPSQTLGTTPYSRRLFFILDRSGSMTGEPFQEATNALIMALRALTPHQDYFAIIVFDHEFQIYPPKGGMLTVTEVNISNCSEWIESNKPARGGTKILPPLQTALDVLNKGQDEKSLPFVVLLTDGCVENERKICAMAKDEVKNCRVLTFGIGSYCNWFFLKMLAQIGKGFSDVVVYKEQICKQVLQLINMASYPVLTDVELTIPDVKEVKMFPFPIPDLFMGAPLTITGKYCGVLPKRVGIRGQTADGKNWQSFVSVRPSEVIPVSKVFIKQRIDLLSAQAWLDQSDELEEEVVDLSCTETMPSPYTVMVAYESNDETKQELEDMMHESDDEEYDENDALSGRTHSKRKKKKWYKNKAALGVIAAGSLTVVGALAFSFGDAGATFANVPVISSFFGDSAGIDLGDLGNCAECCPSCESMECCAQCCDGCGGCDLSDCLIC